MNEPNIYCPNGKRCPKTEDMWLLMPRMAGGDGKKKYLYKGSKHRCSGECIAMKYDRIFGKELSQ